MSLIRANQPILTRLNPHNANKKYIVHGGGGSNCRNFTELTGTQHYTIPTIELPGDFEIRFKFQTDTPGELLTVFGAPQNLKLLGRVETTGTFSVRVGHGTNWAATIISDRDTFADGFLHTGIFTKVGDVYRLVIDSVIEREATNTIGVTPSIGFIGARNDSTNYFIGVIADIFIYSESVFKGHYPINETWESDLILHDHSGNNNDGTAFIVDANDSENYCLNNRAHQWENNNNTKIIPIYIAGGGGGGGGGDIIPRPPNWPPNWPWPPTCFNGGN